MNQINSNRQKAIQHDTLRAQFLMPRDYRNCNLDDYFGQMPTRYRDQDETSYEYILRYMRYVFYKDFHVYPPYASLTSNFYHRYYLNILKEKTPSGRRRMSPQLISLINGGSSIPAPPDNVVFRQVKQFVRRVKRRVNLWDYGGLTPRNWEIRNRERLERQREEQQRRRVSVMDCIQRGQISLEIQRNLGQSRQLLQRVLQNPQIPQGQGQ